MLHPFAVVIKEYTTFSGFAVVLIRVSFGLELCAVVMAGLLIPVTAALDQVNVAPVVALVGV